MPLYQIKSPDHDPCVVASEHFFAAVGAYREHVGDREADISDVNEICDDEQFIYAYRDAELRGGHHAERLPNSPKS